MALRGISTVRLKWEARKRPAAFDDGAAVGLESVGGVVERDVEAEAHQQVGQAVDEEFYPRIIDDLAALDRSGCRRRSPQPSLSSCQ